MISQENIRTEFEKCKELKEYAMSYRYCKKKNHIENINDVMAILNILESIDFLAVLFVVATKEEEIASRYISDFLKRNKEKLVSQIQIDTENADNDKVVKDLQIIYLCMMYLDKDERDKLSKTIFSGNGSIGQIYCENEPENRISIFYSSKLISAIMQFPKEIECGKKYCEIVTSIYHARNNDICFLDKMEIGLRKIKFGYVIDNEIARDYFNLLCNCNAYEAARSFLRNFDGSNGFLGMNCLEFAELLLTIPDTGLLTMAKGLIEKYQNNDYSYDEWCSDVLEKNADEECKKWIKLTFYYHVLMENVQKEDWDSFDQELCLANTYEMINMDKNKYMKQMVDDFAYVCNNILLKRTDSIIHFLEKIEPININAFSRASYLSEWNKSDSVREKFDYESIIKELFCIHSIKDIVYIYMNSHLKSIINIEDFVEKCSDIYGENLKDVFENYPIVGTITLGSRLSSIRDKIFVSPVEISSDVSFSTYRSIGKEHNFSSKEAQDYNKRMIRCHQDWYSRNKYIAELMRNGDLCTFRIHTYKKNKGILAVDFQLDEEIIKQRSEERNACFPVKVMNWLLSIQSSGSFEEWEKSEPIYGIRHINDMKFRVNIALQIVYTIEKLRKNKNELERFIYAITNYPLEEINEFRYISTQKKISFKIPYNEIKTVKDNVLKKAEIIMNDISLPEALRKEIFLNTLIRKFYELKLACEKIGKELYVKTADEPFVMTLKYEEKKDDVYFFSTRGRNNTFFSRCHFLFYGQPESPLIVNNKYFVILNDYDINNDCFTLQEIDLPKEKTDQWHKFLRKVIDLKRATSEPELLEIQNDLKKYSIRVKSKSHILQFTHELDIIFDKKDYSIDDCLKILKMISEKNPFIETNEDYSELKEEFASDYIESYEAFLQEYKDNYKNPMGFCELFFSSYLKVFVDFEKFVDDISGGKYSKEDIVNYCRYKEYLQ